MNHAFDHVQKQVYILENLGCANCAAKMERKIQELPQVDFANIIFATKQLQVVTNTEEELSLREIENRPGSKPHLRGNPVRIRRISGRSVLELCLWQEGY